MSVYMCVYAFVSIYLSIYACIHVCMCICMYIFVCEDFYTFPVHKYIDVCVYMCVCACVCACVMYTNPLGIFSLHAYVVFTFSFSLYSLSAKLTGGMIN